MHLDVVELRKFYYATRLGQMVQRTLRDRLKAMWPDTCDMTVVGYGFAAPFLRPFLERSERVLCLMPAQQGVCPWPGEGPNATALVEETLWPLPNGFVDRLVVAHGLETSERPEALLGEIWRVLAPGGRAIFIVPNRAGLWARRDVTPFGYGRPYSIGQLDRGLAVQKFATERHGGALYHPPSHRRFWLRLAPAIERIGTRLDVERLAGVAIVEATKLVYVKPRNDAKERARRPLRVLEELTNPPRPKPAAGREAATREAARKRPAASH